jgi:hypothetical protein
MRRETGRSRSNDLNLVKGTVAGLIGGLVASWTMNQFQAAWSKAAEGFEKPHGAQSMQPSQGGEPAESTENKEEQDDATVKIAKAVSEGEEKPAGAAVHYAFGSATGLLYGAAAEIAPQVTSGLGLPFGVAFWMVADEAVVPLLGLSKGSTEYPLSTHVYALTSHMVYGLTAEVTRRAVRNIL